MNKVRYGLKNVHIFPITNEDNNGVTEYGDVFKLPGAVSLSLDPAGESEAFYADDCIYDESSSNNGYEGELTVALISEEFETKILGYEKLSDGTVVEKSDARGAKFAMAFEFDGDKKKTRHILYKCIAQRPKVEGNTIEDKKTPQTEGFSFKAIPDIQGLIKAKTQTGNNNYDAFYTAVYKPVAKTTRSAGK